MCGVAGCVVPPGNRPARAPLERMASALEARGPDDAGIELWENVGLVNRRLAIVDPSAAGHQPISDPAGRWTISFNGEVYNHLELRDRLGRDGWRGRSDSETLVRALARWGESAIARCNGPLALAALDRGRRRVLLARDRFQKKPLYVARDDRGVWFASEIKALLAAGLRPAPDRAALAHAALHGWLYGPRTLLAGVERVTGGTIRAIDLESLAQADSTWFDPVSQVDHGLADELARRPAAELADELDRELRDAVERRLLSDVPVGTMLSGGLDSSLLTALAAGAGAKLTAFTASAPSQPRVDESPHARSAARALGIPLETVTIEPARWPQLLVRAVWLHEYPLMNAGVALIEPIAQRASECGVKVLLTGEAADELMAGYDHPHPREMARFLSPPAAAMRAVGAVRRHGWHVVADAIRRRSLTYEAPGPFGPEPCGQFARSSLVARAEAAYRPHEPSRRRLEAELLADLHASSFGHLLNRMDKNAMGASVETRLPFLDPGVTRLILNLPLERRVARTPKAILREVGARHLPARLARRQKQMSMNYDVLGTIRSADPSALADGALRDAIEIPRSEWTAIINGPVPDLWLWTAEIWVRLFAEHHSVDEVERDLLAAR